MTIRQEHILKCGLWTLTITTLFVQILLSFGGATALSIIAGTEDYSRQKELYITGTIGSNAIVIDIFVFAELVSFAMVLIAAIKSNSEIYIGYQIMITTLINIHIVCLLTIIPVFYRNGSEPSYMFIIVFAAIAFEALAVVVALTIVSYNQYYENHDLGIPKLTKKNLKVIIRAKWNIVFIYGIAVVQGLSAMGGFTSATILMSNNGIYYVALIPYFIVGWILALLGVVGLFLLPISIFFFAPTTCTYHVIVINLMFFFSSTYGYIAVSTLIHTYMLIAAAIFLVVNVIPLASSLAVLILKLGKDVNISLTHPFRKQKPPEVQAPKAPHSTSKENNEVEFHQNSPGTIVISTSNASNFIDKISI